MAGAGQHDDLEFPVGEAALGLPGVPALATFHQGEHRGQAMRFGQQRRDARPAGGGHVLLRCLPVHRDHVQPGEMPQQRTHARGHLAQPDASVEDDHVRAAQFAEREDVARLGHLADHGDLGPDGKAGGQGVTEQPTRRLNGYPDGDASCGHAHRYPGIPYLPYLAGYARYLAG